jgi:hypothetical protein
MRFALFVGLSRKAIGLVEERATMRFAPFVALPAKQLDFTEPASVLRIAAIDDVKKRGLNLLGNRAA